MAEATAIINSRPIVPVSSDPDMPFVLSPSVLLTQKTCDNQEDIPFLDIRSMYTSQWKYVQILAEKFWIRWRKVLRISANPAAA